MLWEADPGEAVLHIGIEATSWNLNRGYGRFARELFQALIPRSRHQFTFFSDEAQSNYPFPPGARVQRVNTPRSTPQATVRGGTRPWRNLLAMSWALSRARLDALLFPCDYSFVPVFSKARRVVVVHDITAHLYPQLTFQHPLQAWLWRLKSSLARHQAHQLVTVSEHSRQGLAQQFQLPAERIRVVLEAPSQAFYPKPEARLPERLPEGRRFLTYVGGFAPLKNVPSLIDAFARLIDEHPDLDLVLVGERRNESFYSQVRAIERQIESMNLGARVHFTGFLPDAQVADLLNLSLALVLPSWNEGFGLPAVEAAACGCPVVATRSSPLPELLGEGGVYIDPGSPEQLFNALLQVVSEPVGRGHRAWTAVQQLRWEHSAQQMEAILETL